MNGKKVGMRTGYTALFEMMLNRFARGVGAISALAVLAGCQMGTLPDPNDPGQVGLMDPVVLRSNLQAAYRSLDARASRGDITEQKKRDLLRLYARDLLEHVDFNEIPPKKAWEYGEVFRTAARWDMAERAFRIAAENAKNEDRRVNDSLRLAQSLARLNRVDQAIDWTRKTFTTNDRETAPILPAVLLEIVPAAQGKGHDEELATLLVEAIAQHERTVVDASTDAGKAFFQAKPFHIRNAYAKAIELFAKSGKADRARETAIRADAAMAQFRRA